MVEKNFIFEDFILPNQIKAIESNNNYAKIEIFPFEKGFGITVGNSLRRTLLSSITGAAIYCMKLKNVKHEYQVLEGVKEDIIHIIQNLKKLSINLKEGKTATLKINQSGNKVVTAKDIECSENVEICNPELIIANLVGGEFIGEFFVNIGKGYTIADNHVRSEDEIGTIYIDSIYSPINKVKYEVVKTRVGQSTDYDKIIMEIFSNGAISPEDAVARASKILKECFTIFINFDEKEIDKENDKEIPEEVLALIAILKKSVDELELSIRSQNCLRDAKIKNIYDLVIKNETEIMNQRNFGKKSLTEIKALLKEYGLNFGMSNVLELEKKYNFLDKDIF